MLNDIELEKLNSDLTSLTQTSKTYQNNLQLALESFHDLLERYKSLKSDYEEEKAGREKYKRQAKARSLIQERNPFVLVLIDGNGYLFKEDLVRAGAEGGLRAAQLLNNAIKAELPPDIPDNCRIMVRIYANILDLSAVLARGDLVGKEARSLSMFTASFTRAQNLFDFVDVDAKKGGAKSKIKENFRLFIDNHQCKHIFLGGCHDREYMPMLALYRDERNRVTLIKSANTYPEYQTLGLSMKDLPSVFMSTFIEDRPSPPIDPNKPVCTHFSKGICKFGVSCTKSHLSEEFKNNSSEDPLFKSPPKNLPSLPIHKKCYAILLPKASGNTTSRIPVDKDGGRIDTYTPRPSDDSFQRYKDLSLRLCNKYHLLGSCNDTNCPFDHGHVEPEFIDIIRYQVKRRQCLRGRSCRTLNCIYGHHCQIDGCTGGGFCRMTHLLHSFDTRVARWVKPDDDAEDEKFEETRTDDTGSSNQTNAKDKGIEEFEAMWNGTDVAQTDNESSQSFSVANSTNEDTSPDLLEVEETASNFSIEW